MLNKLCFGGLTNVDSESLNLRNTQIEDGFRIHTSIDYNKSLELINLELQRYQYYTKAYSKNIL